MFIYKCVYVLILCVFGVFCQLQEGDECFGKVDGVNGTCVNIRRCLSSVNDIRQKNYPQLCSYDGKDPIICCTDCDLVNDTSNALVDEYGNYFFKKGRKAEDKCLEYRVKLRNDYSMASPDCKYKTFGPYRSKAYMRECYIYEGPYGTAAVGGEDAKEGEFPHMALLGYGDDLSSAQWLCGGSIISERYILTAAHCIASSSLGPVRYIALGILKRTDPSEQWQRYNVNKIIPHPEYKPPSKYNDIALLQTNARIKFSRLVLPACLHVGNGDESRATATGWGALGYRKELADTLQVVNLEQFTDEECAAAYPTHRHLQNGYDKKSQSCYGDREKIIDTCEGDSGGPLQIASIQGSCIYQIIGVTSYGRACGFPGGTGMYTRVANYVPWIESIVWP